MCTAWVLLASIYFQRCVWSSSPRKEEEKAGGGGLQGLSKRGWVSAAFVGKLGVWAGETGADQGLVASFCVTLSSAGHSKNSREQTPSPVGCEHRAGKSLKVVGKLDPKNQKKPGNR